MAGDDRIGSHRASALLNPRWIYGANLNLDANGNVEAVIDADLVYQFYRAACREKGLGEPAVIVGAH